MDIAQVAVPIVSTLFSISGKSSAADASDALGAQQQAAYDSRAEQMRSNAGQQQAASQRTAIADTQQATLAASKLIAAAGAGGGSGPQIQRLVADILAKGSYNAHMDIYNGEERARQLRADANATTYQGTLARIGSENKATALRTSATGDLFTGAGQTFSMYQKYGGGGPSAVAASGGYVGDDISASMEGFA